MPTTHPRHLACFLAFAFCSIAHAQSPSVTSTQTPDEFMRTEADAISLTAPDMKPWHLRARFKYFAQDGSVQRETVMEEWWAGPGHSKATYTGADFSRTEYRDGDRSLFTGSDKVSAFNSGLILHPLPYPQSLDQARFLSKEISAGTMKLKCLAETIKDSPAGSLPPISYCFDESNSVLQASITPAGNSTSWSDFLPIGGHYLPKQVHIRDGKHTLTSSIEVEQFDSPYALAPSELVPPSDAKPLIRRVILSSGVVMGNRISGREPDYPDSAKSMKIQGTVVLRATISRDGGIKALDVVSGPKQLQKAAKDAVQTWRYQPYLLGGEPAEVETTINVVFQMGAPFR
jgi:TonB family protein